METVVWFKVVGLANNKFADITANLKGMERKWCENYRYFICIENLDIVKYI